MRVPASQLPFGWVCFSNAAERFAPHHRRSGGLNCLSAGSVSLTCELAGNIETAEVMSQLPFGWVCFSNGTVTVYPGSVLAGLNCLSAGSVSLTWRLNNEWGLLLKTSQLPFGWVCFSNILDGASLTVPALVSIAFRLGLFL